MNHELKIWPEFYGPVAFGKKNFEVRENDRGFQAGDTVTLKEWDPKPIKHMGGCEAYDAPVGYTGNEVSFLIGYVLPISEGRVVFSLLPIPEGYAR